MPRGTESPSTPVSCCGNGGGDAIVDADLYIPFAGGRLTLETGVPISTTDQTAKTTVYYTPYTLDKISLFAAPDWVLHDFTERSLSLAGLAANTNFDIFIYDNAGTLTLESVAWTNDTTRATALATQDGVYVKTGELNKRFLGTIRTTGTIGQCEDSISKRFVSNYYNEVDLNLRVIDTTDTWTHNAATWRYARNQSTNRVEYVNCISAKVVKASVSVLAGASGAAGSVGIGIDANNANSAQITASFGGASNIFSSSHYVGFPGQGYHYIAWIEYVRTSTLNYYGDAGVVGVQSGLIVIIKG